MLLKEKMLEYTTDDIEKSSDSDRGDSKKNLKK